MLSDMVYQKQDGAVKQYGENIDYGIPEYGESAYIEVNNNSRYVLVTHQTDNTYNIFDLYEYKFTYNTWMTNISPVYGDNAVIVQSENGFNILAADGSGDIHNRTFNTVYDMQPAAFHEGYYSTTPFDSYDLM